MSGHRNADPLDDMPLAQRRKQAPRKQKRAKANGPHERSALDVLPLEVWREVMAKAHNGGKSVNSLMRVVKSEELRKASRAGKAAWRNVFPLLPVSLVELDKPSPNEADCKVWLCMPTDDPDTKQVIATTLPFQTSVLVQTTSETVRTMQVKASNVRPVSMLRPRRMMSPGDLLLILIQAREEIADLEREQAQLARVVPQGDARSAPETTPGDSAKFHIVSGKDYVTDDTSPFRTYTYLRTSKVLHMLDRAIEVCLYFYDKRYVGSSHNSSDGLINRIYDPAQCFVTGPRLPDVYIHYNDSTYLSAVDAKGERYIVIDGKKVYMSKIKYKKQSWSF